MRKGERKRLSVQSLRPVISPVPAPGREKFEVRIGSSMIYNLGILGVPSIGDFTRRVIRGNFLGWESFVRGEGEAETSQRDPPRMFVPFFRLSDIRNRK